MRTFRTREIKTLVTVFCQKTFEFLVIILPSVLCLEDSLAEIIFSVFAALTHYLASLKVPPLT